MNDEEVIVARSQTHTESFKEAEATALRRALSAAEEFICSYYARVGCLPEYAIKLKMLPDDTTCWLSFTSRDT